MSGFLQHCLRFVHLPNSLSVRYSDEVVVFLEPFHVKRGSFITLDMKDMYYSVPYDKLLSRLRNLREGDLESFQTRASINLEPSSCVFELHLPATLIEMDGKLFTQKKDICISSAVAPV